MNDLLPAAARRRDDCLTRLFRSQTTRRYRALARIAAQHDEIVQLRAANHPSAAVTRLRSRPKSQQKVVGPC